MRTRAPKGALSHAGSKSQYPSVTLQQVPLLLLPSDAFPTTHTLGGPCTPHCMAVLPKGHCVPSLAVSLLCSVGFVGVSQEQDGAGRAVAAGRSQQCPPQLQGQAACVRGSGHEGRLGPALPPNPALLCPCRSSQGFMHMKLSRTQENKYVLGQHSPPFDSVPEIIHHYASRKLPIKGAEHMSLLYPVAIRTL